MRKLILILVAVLSLNSSWATSPYDVLLQGPVSRIEHAVQSSDGVLAFISTFRRFAIYRLRDKTLVSQGDFSALGSVSDAVTFSPNGKTLALTFSGGEPNGAALALVDVASGRMTQSYTFQQIGLNTLRSVAFSGDPDLLALSGSGDVARWHGVFQDLVLFNLRTGRLLPFAGDARDAFDIRFSADHSRVSALVTRYPSYGLFRNEWTLADGKEVPGSLRELGSITQRIPGHEKAVRLREDRCTVINTLSRTEEIRVNCDQSCWGFSFFSPDARHVLFFNHAPGMSKWQICSLESGVCSEPEELTYPEQNVSLSGWTSAFTPEGVWLGGGGDLGQQLLFRPYP